MDFYSCSVSNCLAQTYLEVKKSLQFQFGSNWYPFRALKEEFTNRLGFYSSDFLDGIRGPKTIQKVLSTTVFLYFACLLPSIALGVLNDGNTAGGISEF